MHWLRWPANVTNNGHRWSLRCQWIFWGDTIAGNWRISIDIGDRQRDATDRKRVENCSYTRSRHLMLSLMQTFLPASISNNGDTHGWKTFPIFVIFVYIFVIDYVTIRGCNFANFLAHAHFEEWHQQWFTWFPIYSNFYNTWRLKFLLFVIFKPSK
jgi:hypothetical protein